jgi:hypothetical protein
MTRLSDLSVQRFLLSIRNVDESVYAGLRCRSRSSILPDFLSRMSVYGDDPEAGS